MKNPKSVRSEFINLEIVVKLRSYLFGCKEHYSVIKRYFIDLLSIFVVVVKEEEE